MKQRLSKGHVEFIDGFEYYMLDGRLFRALIGNSFGDDGRRRGEFITVGSGVELALRMARLGAGKPEFGK